MTLLKEGKTNLKYILIVVILAVIVGGGILGWIKMQEVSPELPEVKKPEKELISLEGEIKKENYVSAVVWSIETKDKETYVLIGEKANELINIDEGTKVRLEGYKTETTITIPEAGEFHKYTRKAIEVVSYERVIEDETANWKTYRNEEYGFEIRYPENPEAIEEKGNLVRLYFPGVSETPIWRKSLKISVEDETPETCTDPYPPPDNVKLEEVRIKDIIFHRKTFLENCAMGGQCGDEAYYSTYYNNRCFRLTFATEYNLHPPCFFSEGCEESVIQEYEDSLRKAKEREFKTFNQILSTFRFLE